jgi:hypothetical protein
VFDSQNCRTKTCPQVRFQQLNSNVSPLVLWAVHKNILCPSALAVGTSVGISVDVADGSARLVNSVAINASDLILFFIESVYQRFDYLYDTTQYTTKYM